MLQDPSTGTAVKPITFESMPKTVEQQTLEALLRIEKLLSDHVTAVRVEKTLAVTKEYNERRPQTSKR